MPIESTTEHVAPRRRPVSSRISGLGGGINLAALNPMGQRPSFAKPSVPVSENNPDNSQLSTEELIARAGFNPFATNSSSPAKEESEDISPDLSHVSVRFLLLFQFYVLKCCHNYS